MENDELLHEVHRELQILTKKVESAFPKDENGDHDYAGHRVYHRRVTDNNDENIKSRKAIFTNVISWLVIGLATIVGSALVHTYLPLAIK